VASTSAGARPRQDEVTVRIRSVPTRRATGARIVCGKDIRDRRGDLAGAKAAETLRSEGFDGRILLIGAEHERRYERPPYCFSDQYELGMEYSGYATSWDELVFRGDPGGREFIRSGSRADASWPA
jgi:hypothetical protein